jgi:hypothetical protein
MLASGFLPFVFRSILAIHPSPGHACPVMYFSKANAAISGSTSFIHYLPLIPCLASWIAQLPVVLLLSVALVAGVWRAFTDDPIDYPPFERRPPPPMTTDDLWALAIVSLWWIVLFLVIISGAPVLYWLGYFR